MYLNIDNRELATILASLRYWQRNDRQDARKAPEYKIATDGGDVRPLGNLEIDELCKRINAEDDLPGVMLAALERASGACGTEVEDVIRAAYAAGLGPYISWPLKCLLMAEIDKEKKGGTLPARLQSVADSLASGSKPFSRFPATKVKRELGVLIRRVGNAPAARFLAKADWQKQAEDPR